jgi:transcriptional regulator with XRE-family HTH domain
MSLGEKVKKLRRKYGWTQADLAEKIDRKQNTISYIENGGGVEMDTLKALADIFNVTPDYLMEDDIAITPHTQPEYVDSDIINQDTDKSNVESTKETDKYDFVFDIVATALNKINNPDELDDEKMAYFKALFKQAIENKIKKNSTNE